MVGENNSDWAPFYTEVELKEREHFVGKTQKENKFILIIAVQKCWHLF